MLHIDKERDVDGEGDEREHGRQEREEGSDEGDGDVRGEGEEEGDEGDAGGWGEALVKSTRGEGEYAEN